MRKVLFGIIAILTVFAMISCDNGTTTKTFTVTYDGNGNTGGTVPKAQSVADGGKITIASGEGLVKNDLNFGGWNTKTDGTGDNYAAGDNVTMKKNLKLYVKWTSGEAQYSYTVTFDKNAADATAPNPATRTVQSPSTTVSALPGVEPTREGYVFKGYNLLQDGSGDWFKAGTPSTGATVVTGNMIVYAQWKAGYLIKFDKNCDDPTVAEPNPPQVELDVDDPGELTSMPANKIPAALTRDYFNFLGWYIIQSEAEVTGDNDLEDYKFTKDTEITESFTVYALWKFVGGTPTVVDGTLVHNRPLLEMTDDTNGSTLNADGSITMTFKAGGSKFKYTIPALAFDTDGITPKYDFLKVEYAIVEKAGNWETTQIHVRDGLGAKIVNGTRFASPNDYVPFDNEVNKGLIYELSYMNGGFILNDYKTTEQGFTVLIKSVTYYTSPKYKVTFDWNYDGSQTTKPAASDVENIWGPLVGHPGYSVGTAKWPVTPDRSGETAADGTTPDPWFFMGWFEGLGTDNEDEVTSGTIITKNTALKAKWTDVEPPKIEKITTKANSPVPVYQFVLPTGKKWADIKSVTYTIYINDAATLAITEGRQMVVGLINEVAFSGANDDGTTGFYYNSAWGQLRMVYADASVNAWLESGKDAQGEKGGKDKWVTIVRDVNPLASSYTGKDNSGNNVPGITPAGATGTVDTTIDLGTYYLGIGAGCRNTNIASYYIKDVALVDSDGTTKYPATPFYDDTGYYGDGTDGRPVAPTLANGTTKIKDLAFGGGGTGGLTRVMAYNPEP